MELHLDILINALANSDSLAPSSDTERYKIVSFGDQENGFVGTVIQDPSGRKYTLNDTHMRSSYSQMENGWPPQIIEFGFGFQQIEELHSKYMERLKK